MWRNLKLDSVEIEKLVAEFIVWMPVLPYAKMKVKIYENQSGRFSGTTDLRIKRKFDSCPESALGTGNTIEETLKNTIKCFNDILKEDGFEELTPEDIEYSEWSDF